MPTAYTPFFPLSVVVFPGETLQLHVFEARYRQLLSDMEEHNFPFAIPFSYKGSIANYGSLVMLKQKTATYKNGTSDIEIEGIGVIKILSFDAQFRDKLYSGGEIEIENTETMVVDKQLNQLYCLLNDFEFFEHEQFLFYDIAKKLKLNAIDKLKIISAVDIENKEKILKNILLVEIALKQQEKSITRDNIHWN